MALWRWIKRQFRKLDNDAQNDVDRTVNDDHLPSNDKFPVRDGEDFKVWIPFAENVHKTEGIKMRTRGEYSGGYPRGLVVHWTSGWHLSRGKHIRPYPLSNTGLGLEKDARKNALRTCNGGKKNGYNFLVMDVLGKIYQCLPNTRAL